MQGASEFPGLLIRLFKVQSLALAGSSTGGRLRAFAAVTSLFLIGFVLRLLSAMWQPLNLDEGSYLLEAQLLLSGQVPFRDFIAREPIFILLVAAFRGLFGPGYMAGRLLSVFAGTLTTGLLYLLGTRLYSRQVGLAAMAIHAVTPFFIYGGSILKLEPVAVAVSTAAMLVATSVTPSRQTRALLAGMLVGLGVHVRRSMIVLIPVVALLTLFRSGRKWSTTSWCLAAATAGVLIPLAMMIALTTPEWIWNLYGRVFQDNQPLQSRLAVYRTVLIVLTPQIPLALGHLLGGVQKPAGAKGIFVAWGIVTVALGLLLGIGLASWGFGFGILWMPSWQLFAGAALFGVSLASVGDLSICASRAHIPYGYRDADAVVRLWLISIAAFYVAFLHIFVDYFMDFAAVLSLASARVWILARTSWNNKTFMDFRWRGIRWIGVGLMLIVPSIFFLPKVNPFNWPVSGNFPEYNLNERTYPPSLLRLVADAVRRACPRGSVLTGDPIFAVVADRKVFHNLTYPMLYFQKQSPPFNHDPYNLLPSPETLAIKAFVHDVPCFVVGQRTRDWLRWNPPLRRLLAMGYELVTSFGRPGSLSQVSIYVRKQFVPEADTGKHTGLEFEEVRGNWKFSGSWIGIDGGSKERALAILPVRIATGVRFSVMVHARGEGGIIVGYRTLRDYYGIRLINSPDITGLNIFSASESGERSVLDIPFDTFRGRVTSLTVFAFPGLFQISLDGEYVASVEAPIDHDGRLGLLANYGAWFSDVSFFRDPVSLLSR